MIARFRTSPSCQAVERGLPPLLSRMWRYALVLSRDRATAEDLVQMACVRALERCDQFTAGTSLDKWMFRIISSIWLNELRSRKVREGRGQVDPEIALIGDFSGEMETNIFAQQVLLEVTTLPEAQRAAVLLVYVEGFTYQEAAQTLNVPIGTIMSRLAAARSRLAKISDDDADGARPHRGIAE